MIIHKDIEKIMECKEFIEKWLKNLGLELKPSKTRISHTLKEYEGNVGFDFLGFNIRQYEVGKTHSGKCNGKLLGFKTIIKPSKEKIKLHTKKVGEIIDRHKASPQIALINELDPVITGWGNYYRSVCSKETYTACDRITYLQLKRWAERRHPNKSHSWVKNRYWHTVINNKGENGISIKNWVFKTKEGYELKEHAKIEIKRHTKVKGESSPYDGDWIYWSSRRGEHPDVTTRMATLLKKQKGKCKRCGLSFKDGDLLEIDHIIPKSQGGKDVYKNLQVLHRHCHDEKTNEDYQNYPEMGKSKESLDSYSCKEVCWREAV